VGKKGGNNPTREKFPCKMDVEPNADCAQNPPEKVKGPKWGIGRPQIEILESPRKIQKGEKKKSGNFWGK